MRPPEDRLQRIEAIERQLAQRPDGYTSGELARQYDVDPSTIYRDLCWMQEMGTALSKHKRRWRLDHRRSLYHLRLSADEVLALYLAARLLSRHSDEHNPHVVTALEKLSDTLRSRTPLIASHIDRAAAAVRDRPPRPEYVAALETLTQAWAQGRKVRLCYRSYTKGEDTERTFAPYFIEPSTIGYACYVIGHDELRGKIRTLKIERIHNARLTDDGYEIPPAFDPLHLLASAWGVIWQEDGEVEVTVRFAPSVVRRVTESIWHTSQRIEHLPDGSALFTVRIGSTLEIKPWIRQWGADVEVLHPQPLRDEFVTEARALAALYAPY